MNRVGATPQTNQEDCLSLLAAGKPVRITKALKCGAAWGFAVSAITVVGMEAAKEASLGMATTLSYCGLGTLTGIVCCTTSAVVYNKFCLTPQSTDNHIPRRNVSITTESFNLPSTQVIVQQPGGLPPLTIEGNDNDVQPAGTEFAPPPSYSAVVQMRDVHQPPPSYSAVVQMRDVHQPPPSYFEAEQMGDVHQPPSYFEAEQMGDVHQPPPSYSSVVGQTV